MWFLLRRENKSSLEEANTALHEAEESLQQVKERDTEVLKITSDLRRIRERNHFAELLEGTIIIPKRPIHDS